MLPSPLALTRYLWFLRGMKLRLSGALACALLLAAVTAGCGSMSRTSTATPTATATPTPLSPTSAGVYLLTPYALDVLSLGNGSVQRRFPYDNPAASAPNYAVTRLVVADGAPYFVTSGVPSTQGALGHAATVVALRTTDGSVLWRFSLPNSSDDTSYLSSVVDGAVYVVASAFGRPATFYAFSATDGRVLWQVHPYIIRRAGTWTDWRSATVADGVVYLPVQAQDGTQHLLALRATDGTQLWDFRAPTCGEPRPPAVDNGMVYLSCGLIKGDLYGVRASDGTLVWHRGSLGWFASAPVAANGLVYVNGTGTCGPVYNPPCPPLAFYALDEHTGAVRWQVPECSSGDFVTLSDGVLYCNGQFGLIALDPSTGAVRLRYSLTAISAIGRLDLQDPTIASGVIYYVGDERVNAFAAATGALLWQSPTLVDYTNPPTAAIFVVPQAS